MRSSLNNSMRWDPERGRRAAESLRKANALRRARDFTKDLDKGQIDAIMEMHRAEYRPSEIARELHLFLPAVTQVIRRYEIPGALKAPREPLTREQYDAVQRGRLAYATSDEVCKLHKLDIREVNAAWSTIDYKYYLEHRSRKPSGGL